jgi:enolase
MATIQLLQARWILDSRGLPTVFCEIELEQQGRKVRGNASVPSGASTGSHEALELRDGGEAFHGKGVAKAVHHINEGVATIVTGRDFNSARELDELVLSMDKSENKSELGANAILGISMAAHRAFAELAGLELWQYLRRLYFASLSNTPKFPQLMCNVINGGEHADNGLSVQEFMIVPNTGALVSDVQAASEIYHSLKKSLAGDGSSTALGDEGGFAPTLSSTNPEENPTRIALNYLQNSIKEAGYSDRCDLAMDVAATEFYDTEKGNYTVDSQVLNRDELGEFYSQLVSEFPIVSIEDGYSEDDILGWEVMTAALASKIKLIGDDLFVTNPKRFKEVGLVNKIANGVLIKLNQIGSVSETCEMINLAKDSDYITAVSHRSGETTDDFISDLAFASQSEFIKLGAPARGERVAKYNRLLAIQASL